MVGMANRYNLYGSNYKDTYIFGLTTPHLEQ